MGVPSWDIFQNSLSGYSSANLYRYTGMDDAAKKILIYYLFSSSGFKICDINLMGLHIKSFRFPEL